MHIKPSELILFAEQIRESNFYNLEGCIQIGEVEQLPYDVKEPNLSASLVLPEDDFSVAFDAVDYIHPMWHLLLTALEELLYAPVAVFGRADCSLETTLKILEGNPTMLSIQDSESEKIIILPMESVVFALLDDAIFFFETFTRVVFDGDETLHSDEDSRLPSATRASWLFVATRAIEIKKLYKVYFDKPISKPKQG